MPGCSHFNQPGNQRDGLDEETIDWRAVCGKTARTVRREGSVKADPYPYHDAEPQVCSTDVNPIFTQRRLGSAAIVISVSDEALNSRSY